MTSRNPKDLHDRRDFLRLAGAAAMAAAGAHLLPAAEAPGSAPHWAADIKPAYAPFRMTIQSYSLRKMPFEAAVEAVFFDLKCNAVELWPEHFPMGLPEADFRRRLKTMRQNNKMRRMGWGVAEFGKDHGKNEEVFEFAKKLGIYAILAYPEAESFESLGKLVAKYDMRVAIHNHGPNDKRYGTPDLIAKALEGVADKRIGLCIDTGHFLLAGVNPVDVAMKFKDRIHSVHLKDIKDEGGKKEECILGKGSLDLVGFLKVLKEAKFPGGLALEYELEPDNPVPSMKKCLEAVQEAVKKL